MVKLQIFLKYFFFNILTNLLVLQLSGVNFCSKITEKIAHWDHLSRI